MLQAMWKKLVLGKGKNDSEPLPSIPSRLLTDHDLKPFYEAMKIYDVSNARVASSIGTKRKSEYLGGLDTKQYGRGKRAREVGLLHMIFILIMFTAVDYQTCHSHVAHISLYNLQIYVLLTELLKLYSNVYSFFIFISFLNNCLYFSSSGAIL